MVCLENRVRVAFELFPKPLLQGGFGQVEDLGIALLVEEEHGFVAVVPDKQWLVFRDGWRVWIERVPGQHHAIDDRPEPAGTRSSAHALASAVHP